MDTNNKIFSSGTNMCCYSKRIVVTKSLVLDQMRKTNLTY
ncbi:hypothetical protein BLGI_5045 [Brevibacillus laterosporus GI-9]|nr:hypothetical protein BLGI_5045 [Brevibacillus laterosporus GI-9]